MKATKCKYCRRAYVQTKVDQKYCSAKCRQAAYRRRKPQGMGKTSLTPEKPLLVAFCEHCGGSFWAQRGRARFCSTSCRTLYHRALKAAIPEALEAAYGIPREKALDILETQSLKQVRGLLRDSGFLYKHEARAWVKGL